jgi:hypothetical protein
MVGRQALIALTPAELLAVERAALLLGPLALAAALVIVLRPNPREATAAMVAFLWQLPALYLLHLLGSTFGWWSFAAARNELSGFPIDVWIGWAIWWGPVAVLATRLMPPALVVAVAVALDVTSMPLLTPLVQVHDGWWVGEAVAVMLCLVPALTVAILTRDDRRPALRAVFHVLGWGGYLVLLIPAAVLAFEGRGLVDFWRLPASFLDVVLSVAACFLLFVGIAATVEFATVGQGTPIPFDPPKRVVSTGPYAFVANPMQIISALVMLVFAGYARSWGLALIAVSFAIFDATYARWYNTAHIAHAMPDAWRRFSGEVPEWSFRWHPFVEGQAEVAISRDGPARWIWDRLWLRACAGMTRGVHVRAREPCDGPRLRYRRRDAGIDEKGMLAAARLLEHGPLPLAVLGWVMRFPPIGAVLQVVSGLAVRWWRREPGRPKGGQRS